MWIFIIMVKKLVFSENDKKRSPCSVPSLEIWCMLQTARELTIESFHRLLHCMYFMKVELYRFFIKCKSFWTITFENVCPFSSPRALYLDPFLALEEVTNNFPASIQRQWIHGKWYHDCFHFDAETCVIIIFYFSYNVSPSSTFPKFFDLYRPAIARDK